MTKFAKNSIRQVCVTLLGARNDIKVCLKILPRFDIWSVRYCSFNNLLIWLKSAYSRREFLGGLGDLTCVIHTNRIHMLFYKGKVGIA